MILIENTNYDRFDVYKNLYKLLYAMSQDDSKITNLHSVDKDKTNRGTLNIVYEYNYNIRVMINITDTDVEIIAPDYIRDNLISKITTEYPEYSDIIK